MPDINVSCHLQKNNMELWDGHEYSYSELQHVATGTCSNISFIRHFSYYVGLYYQGCQR